MAASDQTALCPICLSQLVAQLGLPFFSAYPFHTEIIERVTRGEQPPFRPSMDLQSHLEELGQLMQRCWAEDPQERPPFQQIRLALRKFNKSVVSRNDSHYKSHTSVVFYSGSPLQPITAYKHLHGCMTWLSQRLPTSSSAKIDTPHPFLYNDPIMTPRLKINKGIWARCSGLFPSLPTVSILLKSSYPSPFISFFQYAHWLVLPSLCCLSLFSAHPASLPLHLLQTHLCSIRIDKISSGV